MKMLLVTELNVLLLNMQLKSNNYHFIMILVVFDILTHYVCHYVCLFSLSTLPTGKPDNITP